jgi:hypothetical protein
MSGVFEVGLQAVNVITQAVMNVARKHIFR